MHTRTLNFMLGQKLTAGDRLLLALAVVSLGALYAVYWGQSVYGNQAAIAIAGKHWLTIDLYQEQVINVEGRLGDSKLEIKDGKIRFISSPCDTKQCIHQGWIHQSGEIAACVPNAISVRILGPDPRFDTMNF
ncbi:NusG domain II-containing protein [Kaarinaea lacus]